MIATGQNAETSLCPSTSAHTAELDRLIARQRCAQRHNPNPDKTIRRDRLRRAADLLIRHQNAIIAAINTDFGRRDNVEIRFVELYGTLAALRYAHKHLGRWMRRERRSLPFPLGLFAARAWVDYVPQGLVGIIAPWNVPVHLVFSPLAGILAAGNRAIIKPSEHVPATSALLAEIIPTSFDDDEIAVLPATAAAGKALSNAPIDHLLYIGGKQVAPEILRATATHLVPTTLELGGKSPAIIARSALCFLIVPIIPTIPPFSMPTTTTAYALCSTKPKAPAQELNRSPQHPLSKPLQPLPPISWPPSSSLTLNQISDSFVRKSSAPSFPF